MIWVVHMSFGKKNLYCTFAKKIDDIQIHDEEKSHSFQMQQLSTIQPPGYIELGNSAAVCPCLRKAPVFRCVGQNVEMMWMDHSDWHDVLEMSQVFQSLLFLLRSLLMTLARSKFLDAKPILGPWSTPTSCMSYFFPCVDVSSGLLCSHFPTCKISWIIPCRWLEVHLRQVSKAIGTTLRDPSRFSRYICAWPGWFKPIKGWGASREWS